MKLEDTVTPYSSLSREQKRELIEKRRKERFRSKKSSKSKATKERVSKRFQLESSINSLTPEEAREILRSLDKNK